MIPTFFGEAGLEIPGDAPVEGGWVHVVGREWYEIRNHDRLPPFFLSLVSSSDHWWFVASTGGMTAGRRDADHAFLPYETEDKLTFGGAHTGPLTILRVHEGGRVRLWEPLSTLAPRVDRIERRLRKSVEGDALAFEESNLDLGLTFTMTLRFGERVGFVRSVALRDDTGRTRRIDVLDGYRNVLPHGATKILQNRMSCLLDAYKRNELDPATGVATFSLSSILTDRVEASEALLLLDIRPQAEFAVSRLPGAVRVDPDASLDAALTASGGALSGARVVVYCSVGERSARLAARLQDGLVAAGAASVSNLEGGLFGWANDGRDLVDDAGPTRRVHPFNRAWGRLVADQTRLAR